MLLQILGERVSHSGVGIIADFWIFVFIFLNVAENILAFQNVHEQTRNIGTDDLKSKIGNQRARKTQIVNDLSLVYIYEKIP